MIGCMGTHPMVMSKRIVSSLILSLPLSLHSSLGLADELDASSLTSFAAQADMVWTLVAAALVMMMQIGFLLLEAGMVRSKNSINVAQKNLLDFVFSVLVFGAVGFMFAFGTQGNNLFAPVGWSAEFFMLRELTDWQAAFFVFQVMFCGTAATIVSGAVAERMRLHTYVLGAIVMSGFIYPVFVHWAWGAALGASDMAWLGNMGFVDFAGSTVVHATGAWVALAAVIILGPRLGRFDTNGKPIRIAGHSPVLAGTGALLLFFGWIGFNGGSTVASVPDIAPIILNTVMAGSAGAGVAYLLGWYQDGLILPEKAISGMLGGLVAVTAGCAVLDAGGATLVGIAGGVAAVLGARLLESVFKIDDAVNAIGVHGFSGATGTLLLALLAPAENLPLGNQLDQLYVQATGVGVNFVWAFGLGWVFFKLLDRFIRVRVEVGAEERGLNEAEHATRMGIGHVEDALGALAAGKADLDTRLKIDPGDEAEQLTRTFNELLDNLQKQEDARNRALEERRSDEEADRLAALADATFEALCISADGIIIDGNAAFESLVGAPIASLKGRQLLDNVAEAHRAQLAEHMVAGVLEPREVNIYDINGNLIPVEVRGRDIIYRGSRTRVSAISDLRDRKKAEARIRFLAQHDPLTNLPNRALFNDKLDNMIQQTIATGTPSAVLMIDLDHFKDINDLHGHPAGDEVIKVTAERLRATVRQGDMVARLGGDEFGVLQAGVQFANQAEELAHRIVAELSRPVQVAPGVTIRLGASAGVAICPRDGLQGAQLISRADTALYTAKNSGRNQYSLFEPGMDAELRKRQTLEADLTSAIENDELHLHFQPRMDLSEGRIISYEALLRWFHPEKGRISPADFIPVAENSGKIVAIGTKVLQDACQLAMEHLGEAAVSVNVSPVQFRDRHFIETVSNALNSSGLPADRLEIEITESVLIDDDKRAHAILNGLKALGIRIALDDFGTGYSSLGYLSRFPFDVIKIDRSFLQNARQDENALAIVDTIIRLGRALNMNIVAEGVEHLDEVEMLASRGCHEIQGFVLGKAEPVDQLLTSVPQPIVDILNKVHAPSAAATDTQSAENLRKAATDLRKKQTTPRQRRRKAS
jgi:Amt family ammonium transporter